MATPLAARVERALDQLVRRGSSSADILRETAQQLASEIPNDGWCGLTLDPSTLVATGGVHEHGLTPSAIRRLLEIEYGEVHVDSFVELARARLTARALSHTSGEQPRGRDVLKPSGYLDELRVVLRSSGTAWGALVLFRRDGRARFTKQEAAVAGSASALAGDALRRALLVETASNVQRAPDRGLLVLGPDNTIESATPEARRLLDELAEHGPPDPQSVPHTVQAIAIEARRASGVAPSRSRACTRSGAWVTLHAALLAADGERVAIFIEPTGAFEIASLIVKAYALSKRESALVRLVLHGLDTEQIARALEISTYTVQDHLKSIFQKVGVNSRKELVSRIFFTHCMPRMGDPIGPDGWFA